jgi:predicted MFS family arabinose efflux permease
VRLFRDPRLSSASAAIMLAFFSLSGAFFFTGFYTQNVRGYSPLHAGLLTIPLAAGQLLTAPRTAALVRRLGAKAVVTTGLLVVAVALAGYCELGVSTPVWYLELIFAVQGCGMGLIMPPSTEGVMSVVPRDRGGAGSAITNTSRQVAVALGVAVLGSVLGQAYRTRLAPHLGALPAAARLGATQSIAQTQAIAAHLGHAGPALLAAADAAFVHGMHLASAVSVGIAVLGAAATLAWMPGRRVAAAPDPITPAEPALAGPADD